MRLARYICRGQEPGLWVVNVRSRRATCEACEGLRSSNVAELTERVDASESDGT